MLRSPFLCALLAALVALLLQSSSVDASMAFLKKKTYTPLIFFKVPKGTMDECEF